MFLAFLISLVVLLDNSFTGICCPCVCHLFYFYCWRTVFSVALVAMFLTCVNLWTHAHPYMHTCINKCTCTLFMCSCSHNERWNCCFPQNTQQGGLLWGFFLRKMIVFCKMLNKVDYWSLSHSLYLTHIYTHGRVGVFTVSPQITVYSEDFSLWPVCLFGL